RSPSRARPSRRSRVTPGKSSTNARRLPTRRLNSVDLPTFGRPTMATVKLMIEWLRFPDPSNPGRGSGGQRGGGGSGQAGPPDGWAAPPGADGGLGQPPPAADCAGGLGHCDCAWGGGSACADGAGGWTATFGFGLGFGLASALGSGL